MTQTREETAAKRRAYYLAHREEALAKRKAYYEKNREAILAAGREERTNKRKADTSGRTCWKDVLAQARTIVESYEDTGVTLRQLFYRLVAAELVPNTKNAYQTLSKRSAEARRDGTFPDLIDHTRQIHRYLSYRSPEAALADLRSFYRRDRTEGQMQTVYIGVEKNGMVEQLQSWFGDLGLPILALGGYASQAYVKQVYQDACREGREAVLLYAGDFDPSGEDIPRDFAERAGCFDEVHRVALTVAQVDAYGLPEQMVKEKDSRAAAFIAKYGRGVVELDALPPDTLRQLYQDELDEFWDADEYDDVLDREAEERWQL